jgi:DNA-binding transcriptional LysR family regulator
MYDWSDLKIFLAAARARSMLEAAGELGVNQSTVTRRIAALEKALEIRLFHRNRDGCRLNEVGESLLSQAARVATEAEAFERLVAQCKRKLSGVIRVTTLESIANQILTPLLSEFIEQYPDIKVELIATNMRLDLMRGDADIAIRACRTPTQSGIVVRKLANDPWKLYCSPAYAEKRGVPGCASDLDNHVLIGADGEFAKLDPFVWLSKTVVRALVRSVCSNLANMVAAIEAGHGVGPLPNSIGVPSDLIECFAMPDFKLGIYLITRESLKDAPRVKAFTEFIGARASLLRRTLERRRSKV